MGTTLRPELSMKNRYWIEKHRYYELKHFCLQYPLWEKSLKMLDGYKSNGSLVYPKSDNTYLSTPTEDCMEARAYYTERIELLERVSVEAADEISDYILKGVTEGLSFDILKVRYAIPCCKDKYYELYRKFFYLLSKSKY